LKSKNSTFDKFHYFFHWELKSDSSFVVLLFSSLLSEFSSLSSLLMLWLLIWNIFCIIVQSAVIWALLKEAVISKLNSTLERAAFKSWLNIVFFVDVFLVDSIMMKECWLCSMMISEMMCWWCCRENDFLDSEDNSYDSESILSSWKQLCHEVNDFKISSVEAWFDVVAVELLFWKFCVSRCCSEIVERKLWYIWEIWNSIMLWKNVCR